MGNRILRNKVHVDNINIEQSESFEIVWLDNKSEESYSEKISSLKQYRIHFFHNVNECWNYLLPLRTDAKVIFIVNEQLSDRITNEIHNLCPIKFIFVICSADAHVNTGPQLIKIKYVNLDELVNRIDYVVSRFIRSTEEFFSIDIFQDNPSSENSTTELNGRFLFTQLIIDIILQMKQKVTDKDELIVQCTKLFVKNPYEIKTLQKFHMKYKPEDVFTWYTKNAFIYRQVNRALRTQNIELLFLYRFFLQDLQNELSLHQIQSSMRVYRGQVISKQELRDISNAVNQYISLNTFLSTSVDQSVAEMYIAGVNMNVDKSEKVPVIFEIEANPHEPGGVKPFADISAKSQFPEENEILFMIGNIFQIESVSVEPEFTRIKLKLCGNDKNQLRTIFESIRKEQNDGLDENDYGANLNLIGIVLYDFDKTSTADRFFRRIYHELPGDDPRRIRYCLNIGNAASKSGDDEEAGRWYKQGFDLCEKHQLIDKPLMGYLCLAQANLYSKLKQRKQAVEEYNKALKIFKDNYGENHPVIATCLSCMANQFHRWRYYNRCLALRQKALYIAEQTLPAMHPSLPHYHRVLSLLLFQLKHRNLNEALRYAQQAFDIGQMVISPNSPELLNIYRMLCEVHRELNNFEQVVFWSNKIENYNGLKSNDTGEERVLAPRKDFLCKRCYRVVWIYRWFYWMKDTRLNCLIFHVIPEFFVDMKRRIFNY